MREFVVWTIYQTNREKNDVTRIAERYTFAVMKGMLVLVKLIELFYHSLARIW